MMCTWAKIKVGAHVMTGLGVTFIIGSHRYDIAERIMESIKNDEKLRENAQDIVLEGDKWIGANVTILKEVTVGMGGNRCSWSCYYTRCTSVFYSGWSTSSNNKNEI